MGAASALSTRADYKDKVLGEAKRRILELQIRNGSARTRSVKYLLGCSSKKMDRAKNVTDSENSLSAKTYAEKRLRRKDSKLTRVKKESND